MDNQITSLLQYSNNGFTSSSSGSATNHNNHQQQIQQIQQHHYKSIQQHSPHSSTPNISTENVDIYHSQQQHHHYQGSASNNGGGNNYPPYQMNGNYNFSPVHSSPSPSSSSPHHNHFQSNYPDSNNNNIHNLQSLNDHNNHHQNNNNNGNGNGNLSNQTVPTIQTNNNNNSNVHLNLPPIPQFPTLNDSVNGYATPSNMSSPAGSITPSTTPTSTPTPRFTSSNGSSPFQSQFQNLLESKLSGFWLNQIKEIHKTEDFKTHELPLARIKKIMKSDKDVNKISSEAPILFAKACEILILEMTHRSWIHTEMNKRRTLQRTDIINSLSRCETFDFLIDMLPRDEIKQSRKYLDEFSKSHITPEYVQYLHLQQMAESQNKQGINSSNGGNSSILPTTNGSSNTMSSSAPTQTPTSTPAPTPPNQNQNLILSSPILSNTQLPPSQPQFLTPLSHPQQIQPNDSSSSINNNYNNNSNSNQFKRSYSMEIHQVSPISTPKKRSNSQDYNFHYNELNQSNSSTQINSLQPPQLQSTTTQIQSINLPININNSNIITQPPLLPPSLQQSSNNSNHSSSSFDYSFNADQSSDEHQLSNFKNNNNNNSLNESNFLSNENNSNNHLSSSPSSRIYYYSDN